MKNLKEIDSLFGDLQSKDDKIRYNAFQELLAETESPVKWIYDKWFELVEKLSSENSFHRSIGLMLLANLCKSDTENKMGALLEKYLGFFEDEKFITSRQCIQNSWKIAIVNKNYKTLVVKKLQESFYDNINLNKHGNLIKQDIIYSLQQIKENTDDTPIQQLINKLIDSEIEPKIVKSLKKFAS